MTINDIESLSARHSADLAAFTDQLLLAPRNQLLHQLQQLDDECFERVFSEFNCFSTEGVEALAAFVLWRLLKEPQERVIVASGVNRHTSHLHAVIASYERTLSEFANALKPAIKEAKKRLVFELNSDLVQHLAGLQSSVTVLVFNADKQHQRFFEQLDQLTANRRARVLLISDRVTKTNDLRDYHGIPMY